ncbi:bifunctional biotin--[acetyl-CoA-carboxylase] ligase/biotin operon repressor BirA [Pseudoxanthomonas dokdonensis]|uniref:Bifunctional ligase/repressor BirA n=1 Tax=Pseudoxanthomonas dokdonensis TaxID=344882 RepID=A0A0R0CJ01_9GAMM|nr:bifunctional biotin--[acetyl-CoA-carboxylase] ligase/biotin operon repressor BirA [Pseudoxanthomonas dokdonensis]KRG69557.1 biotin--protein ligase [Pseudoxanthomonas dokdonensis]
MSGEQALLRQLAAGPVSGDALAREAGLTRAAVWKRIQALREAGLVIDARPGQGYQWSTPLALLDAAAISAELAPAVRQQLQSLEVAWSLDSTNAELLRRPTPREGVAALLAEQQTQGRGRRGRQWASPLAANLYLSVARHFSGGLARLGGLSLVAGVAVAEALREAGFHEVGLKWPNDLVAGERKLGGLLIEGGGEHGGPVRAVIGLGINVRMPAPFAARIDQPWIDLANWQQPVPSRNQLAARILSRLLPALDTFDRDGLACFSQRYATLDVLRGRAVDVHQGDGSVQHGLAEGIADDGALQVRIDGRLQAVHAGEVSIRATA